MEKAGSKYVSSLVCVVPCMVWIFYDIKYHTVYHTIRYNNYYAGNYTDCHTDDYTERPSTTPGTKPEISYMNFKKALADDPDFLQEVFDTPIDLNNDYDDESFMDQFMSDYFQ